MFLFIDKKILRDIAYHAGKDISKQNKTKRNKHTHKHTMSHGFDLVYRILRVVLKTLK